MDHLAISVASDFCGLSAAVLMGVPWFLDTSRRRALDNLLELTKLTPDGPKIVDIGVVPVMREILRTDSYQVIPMRVGLVLLATAFALKGFSVLLL